MNRVTAWKAGIRWRKEVVPLWPERTRHYRRFQSTHSAWITRSLACTYAHISQRTVCNTGKKKKRGNKNNIPRGSGRYSWFILCRPSCAPSPLRDVAAAPCRFIDFPPVPTLALFPSSRPLRPSPNYSSSFLPSLDRDCEMKVALLYTLLRSALPHPGCGYWIYPTFFWTCHHHHPTTRMKTFFFPLSTFYSITFLPPSYASPSSYIKINQTLKYLCRDFLVFFSVSSLYLCILFTLPLVWACFI